MRSTLVLLLVVCAGCDRAEEPADEAPEAPAVASDSVPGQGAASGGMQVQFTDAQGNPAGTATLSDESNGLRIQVRVTGLSPGEHGFHIHQTAACDPPAFESAGSHYSPEGKQHGMQNPQGPHAGDLPNLRAGDDGVADTTFVAPGVQLHTGAANFMGGRALVVHAQPDDYRTDPAGNSGNRVACGVVRM